MRISDWGSDVCSSDLCSLGAFEAATGLSLSDSNGLKDELPPITTFLNRMLALTIDLQNILFTAFEDLLTARIEGAIAAGSYEMGLETLQAESFTKIGRASWRERVGQYV